MKFKSTDEIKNLPPEKLAEELKETQKRLVELKFKKSIDRITDTSEFRRLRRYIAKLMTFIHSKKQIEAEKSATKK
ncbi:MAG: 50S ribosomal protein L29 [Planctomycetota bacterium]